MTEDRERYETTPEAKASRLIKKALHRYLGWSRRFGSLAQVEADPAQAFGDLHDAEEEAVEALARAEDTQSESNVDLLGQMVGGVLEGGLDELEQSSTMIGQDWELAAVELARALSDEQDRRHRLEIQVRALTKALRVTEGELKEALGDEGEQEGGSS